MSDRPAPFDTRSLEAIETAYNGRAPFVGAADADVADLHGDVGWLLHEVRRMQEERQQDQGAYLRQGAALAREAETRYAQGVRAAMRAVEGWIGDLNDGAVPPGIGDRLLERLRAYRVSYTARGPEPVAIPTCPACAKAGRPRLAIALERVMYLAAPQHYYDELGRHHVHGAQRIMRDLRCACGRAFSDAVEPVPCLWGCEGEAPAAARSRGTPLRSRA